MPTLSQADLVDSRSTSANPIRPMPLTGRNINSPTIDPPRWSGQGEDARAPPRGYQAGTVAVRSTRAASSQSVPPGLHGKVPPPVEPLVRAVPRHGQAGRMDDPLEDHG